MWTNGSFPHIVCGYIKVTIKSSLKMHMITTNAQNTMKNKLKRFFMNLNAKRRKKKCLSQGILLWKEKKSKCETFNQKKDLSKHKDWNRKELVRGLGACERKKMDAIKKKKDLEYK